MDLNPAFEDSVSFIRREYRLILPVAFSTLGLSVLLLGAMIPPMAQNGQLPPGDWMWWLVPTSMLAGIGALALSALRLFPGMSVGEAMGCALRHILPLCLVMLASMVALIIGLTILGILLMVVLTSTPEAAVVQAMVFGLPFSLYIGARLALVSSALVSRGPDESAISAVRRALRLVRGHAWRIALIMLAASTVYLFLLFTLTAVLGSTLLIFGRLIGNPALGETLLRLLIALYASSFFAAFSIVMASIYQRLSGRTNGI
jgi:hypothetical protein